MIISVKKEVNKRTTIVKISQLSSQLNKKAPEVNAANPRANVTIELPIWLSLLPICCKIFFTFIELHPKLLIMMPEKI